MNNLFNQRIELLNWRSARDDVNAVNPILTKIIDEWSPPSDFTIIKMRYGYGNKILKNGVLQIPANNRMLYPFSSSRIPDIIRDELLYSNVPLGVISHNGTEVFLEDNERIIPLAFFKPGVILGLWETLEPQNSYYPKRIWDVAAGARSSFMLPKISQAGLHEKLKKKYSIHSPAPKNAFTHGHIFSELAHSIQFNSPWYNEILFFGKKWIQRDTKNIGWLRFHHHLLEQAWQLSDYNRNFSSYDRIWKVFSHYLECKNIKPNQYLIDTLKHLIMIGTGAAPGYIPSANLEIAGPIKKIQEIYIKDYGLNNYIPTVMVPEHYNTHSTSPYTYYSLQMPTLFNTIPKSSSQQSVMTELRDLKYLVHEFIQAAFDNQLKIDGTPIDWLVNNIDFDFFHSDDDTYKQILDSRTMPNKDKKLIHIPGKMRGRKFAYNGSFVRGCVRLSHSFNI